MPDLSTLLKAVAFAAEKHRDQRRKGVNASPYINHPIEVAWMIAEAGETDLTTLVAAVLHDTIEDTKTTPEEIEAAFGPEVRAIVMEVTEKKRKTKTPEEEREEKRERKASQLAGARHLSRPAKIVRIADKTANVRDILDHPPDWDAERKREYFTFARNMVDACRDALPELASRFDKVYERTHRTA